MHAPPPPLPPAPAPHASRPRCSPPVWCRQGASFPSVAKIHRWREHSTIGHPSKLGASPSTSSVSAQPHRKDTGLRAELEPNHSHFLFVDGGADQTGVFGKEIDLRAQLENHLCESTEHDEQIATMIVCVAVGGGEGTLRTVLQVLKKSRPVVVLSNSGGAAREIYDYVHNGVLPEMDLAESAPPHVRKAREKYVTQVAPEMMPEVKRLGERQQGLYNHPLLTFFGITKTIGGTKQYDRGLDTFLLQARSAPSPSLPDVIRPSPPLPLPSLFPPPFLSPPPSFSLPSLFPPSSLTLPPSSLPPPSSFPPSSLPLPCQAGMLPSTPATCRHATKHAQLRGARAPLCSAGDPLQLPTTDGHPRACGVLGRAIHCTARDATQRVSKRQPRQQCRPQHCGDRLAIARESLLRSPHLVCSAAQRQGEAPPQRLARREHAYT